LILLRGRREANVFLSSDATADLNQMNLSGRYCSVGSERTPVHSQAGLVEWRVVESERKTVSSSTASERSTGECE
jgi:hypothetical protein